MLLTVNVPTRLPMVSSRRIFVSLLVLSFALFAACGGSSDDAKSSGSSPAPETGSPAAASSPEGGSSGGESATPEAFDVCALLSPQEIEGVIGGAAGSPAPEEPIDSGGVLQIGCRYEENGITPVVTVGVIVAPDKATAKDVFDLGSEQYPAVDGIGDGAYNSQPIDDLTVLTGRYEISIGVYFVSDDDAAELGMARQLAQLVIGRVP